MVMAAEAADGSSAVAVAAVTAVAVAGKSSR